MKDKRQIEEINYGSLITSTKCYNCIHFPLCFAQKGGVNLGLASENDCCYYQPKIDKDSVILTREQYDDMFTFQTTDKPGHICGFYNILDTVRKVERDETIEKILKLAKEYNRGYLSNFDSFIEELEEQLGCDTKE